jgi:hypothetical protein
MGLKGPFSLAISGAKPSVKLPVTPAVINGTVTLKNVSSCWNNIFFFYLETAGIQNSYLYLNVHFFNASFN